MNIENIEEARKLAKDGLNDIIAAKKSKNADLYAKLLREYNELMRELDFSESTIKAFNDCIDVCF